MIESTALRALGILGGDPLVRLMNRLREGDPAVEDDLRAMERAAAMLALTAPAADPPLELRRRVLSRVASDGYYLLRERDSEWEPAGISGAYVRRLYMDARAGQETLLVRLLPSAPSDALAALVGPDFYVVSGEVQVDGTRLEIGDFFHGAGVPPLGRTDSGCLLYSPAGPFGERPHGAKAVGPGRPNGNGSPKAHRRVVVRGAEGLWSSEGVGVYTKRLVRDPERGTEIYLVRMERGATWDPHHHDGAEEVFLIRGDWQCLGRNLHPGDYHRAGAGTEHAATTSKSGCKMVVAVTGSPGES